MLFIYLTASVCYLAVGIYLSWRLTAHRTASTDLVAIKPSKPVTLGLSLMGLIAHGITLYPYIVTPYGLNFNVFNVTSLITLFFLLFYVLFCLYRPILSLGILAAPVALIGLNLGYFGVAPYSPLTNISRGLEIHILLSIAAYCMLFMAAIQAIIMRFQIRELKHKTIHRFWVNNLPSLQSMESLLFDMILVGFVLLSFALSLGFVYVEDLMMQHLAHKTVFSILSWLMFGGLLIGHWKSGWRGKRAANVAILAFGLLAIGFIGSKVVLELILS